MGTNKFLFMKIFILSSNFILEMYQGRQWVSTALFFFLILINIDGVKYFLKNSKNIGKIVPLYGTQFLKLNNFFNKFE